MPERDLQMPMKKVTVRFFTRDIDVLKLYYRSVGYNHVLRALAHRHAMQLENNTAERLSKEELKEGES